MEKWCRLNFSRIWKNKYYGIERKLSEGIKKNNGMEVELNKVKSAVFNAIKGDNQGIILANLNKINKDIDRKLSEMKALTGKTKAKMQQEIRNLENRLRELEKEEKEK